MSPEKQISISFGCAEREAGAKIQKGKIDMTYTTNYQLPQWVKSDRILMDDFNDANSKIDAALTMKCEAVAGTYNGSDNDPQTISLGFTPAAVLVLDMRSNHTALAVTGCPACASDDSPAVTIVEGGFEVKDRYNYGTGIVHGPYRYIAFRKLG